MFDQIVFQILSITLGASLLFLMFVEILPSVLRAVGSVSDSLDSFSSEIEEATRYLNEAREK